MKRKEECLSKIEYPYLSTISKGRKCLSFECIIQESFLNFDIEKFNEDENKWIIVKSSNVNKIQIGDLLPDRTYKIRCRVFLSKNSSKYSKEIQVRTLPGIIIFYLYT
jgi:hypothetical protein